MVNYPSFEGKVIKMNHAYPICDENDNPIGYTKIGDMAVITLADLTALHNLKIGRFTDM